MDIKDIKSAIDSVVKRNTARFFMPGHKGLGSVMLHYDVTELDGTDNLHRPQGIIHTAQLAASVAFGALHTFFCVNGSSVGLHTLIMSICKRGDTLIVDRGCHISIINALVLNDVRPVFVYPKYNSQFGINIGIAPDDVAQAISENPSAKGVLITTPTYYGVCSDVNSIANIAHKHNMPLIVDEAHGAHFCFNKDLPSSALECGADGVVQSTHKTLTCLTQGALLHIGTDRIDKQRVQENLNMLHTTSPSYLIMSSIDGARCEMERFGESRLKVLIAECNKVRKKVNETGAYLCLDKLCDMYDYDQTRIVINVGNAFDVQAMLRDSYNILVEMVDGSNIVCIPTINNRSTDFSNLVKALAEIAKSLPHWESIEIEQIPTAKMAMPPTQAYYSQTEIVTPEDSVGKIAARSVYKCPPCMPILCPGEMITKEISQRLNDNITVVCNNNLKKIHTRSIM